MSEQEQEKELVNKLDEMKLEAQDNLNIKQIKFVKEYVANGGQAYRAYMKVYQSKSVPTAKSGASRLLSEPKIQKRLKQEMNRRADELNVITPDAIIGNLSKLIEDEDTPASTKFQALKLLGEKYRLFEKEVAEQKEETMEISIAGLEEE